MLDDPTAKAELYHLFTRGVRLDTKVKFHGNVMTMLIFAIARDSHHLNDVKTTPTSFDLLRYYTPKKINQIDILGHTALHWAASKNKSVVVVRLLAAGINPTIKNNHQLTAANYIEDSQIEGLLEKAAKEYRPV